MFVPLLRISAMLVGASFIVATTSVADDVFPVVKSSTPLLRLTAASKPQQVETPRVFSSGPVLSPNTDFSMAIPPALEQFPEVFSKPPSTELDTADVLLPSEFVGSTTAMAPAMQQYYEPYAPIVDTITCSQPMARDWASLEALVWWTSKSDVPVLATTSPAGVGPQQAGILGGNAQPLFGDSALFGDSPSGFRFRMGHFLNDCDGSGLTAEFFMLGSRGHDFHAGSNGDPIIARPFFNAGTNLQDAQLIAYTGSYRGALNINAETRMYSLAGHLWGELYIDRSCDCGEGCSDGSSCRQRNPEETQLGIKFGPRFMHLDDSLLMDETAVSIASGSSFHLLDSFKTENSFLGGEIGIRTQRQRGPFDLELGLQLAIGATRQELDINGLSVVTTNQGVATTSPGGLLALDSNSGSWDRNRFSLVPGLELSIGYQLKSGWRATVGYNLLYWTNVLRASEQIDGSINTDKIAPIILPSPGPERPSVQFDESDYLAHGISFGLERQW
jgi:hypothetical protein